MNTSISPNTIILPIVHMNGTSRQELLQLRKDLYRAIGQAQHALAEMSPNGRDYYPEKGRLQKAIDQHARRHNMLHDLKAEILMEAELLQDSQ